MGPHSSNKEAFVAMKKCLKAPQVSKQPDGLGLRTCSFFVEFFWLGSNKSIPRPGFLFEQKIIARLSLRLSDTLMNNKGKKRNVEQK